MDMPWSLHSALPLLPCPSHVLELFNQELELGYEDLVELLALMVAW